jgi:prolyl-tRNA synthetase
MPPRRRPLRRPSACSKSTRVFAEEWLAMPVIKGVKTASERFAGAEETYCIEAMMQDGKACRQAPRTSWVRTSPRPSTCLFTNKENKQEHVWATSWGVSTRLMGALIMTHSDDQWLVLPPKLAPVQVAIVPIAKNASSWRPSVLTSPMIQALRAKGITVKFDDDDQKKPGWKFAEYEFKGYPVRIAIGPRDMENGTVEVARRDTLEKQVMQVTDIADKVEHLLQAIQDNLYQKALAMRENSTRALWTATTSSRWPSRRRLHPGPLGWHGRDRGTLVKEETKATIRCIPLERRHHAWHLHGNRKAQRNVSSLPEPTDEHQAEPKAAIPQRPPQMILNMLRTKSGMKQDVYRGPSPCSRT